MPDGWKMGDVNHNGLVDAVDASMVLSEYAALSAGKMRSFSREQVLAADIDRNGVIDAVDASKVLSYYAYLSSGGKVSDMQEWLKK